MAMPSYLVGKTKSKSTELAGSNLLKPALNLTTGPQNPECSGYTTTTNKRCERYPKEAKTIGENTMKDKFSLVKSFLHEMEISIIKEDEAEELVIVEDEENGIKNLVIDCESPIVVIEQLIMKVPAQTEKLYKRLLQLNRELVHGAFTLDDNENFIIFRDTLQLENLDRNELEGSIHALSLALSEHGSELLEYSTH